MTLQANAVFTFKAFEIQQDGSIVLSLTCEKPGDSMPGLYPVTLTPADVATIQAAGNATQQKAKLKEIVTAYLIAQYRTPVSAIATALSTLIGNTLTV
jgi:hypothetical protein